MVEFYVSFSVFSFGIRVVFKMIVLSVKYFFSVYLVSFIVWGILVFFTG